MSNKIMSSGELLSNLNKNIDKTHHKKNDPATVQQSHKEPGQKSKIKSIPSQQDEEQTPINIKNLSNQIEKRKQVQNSNREKERFEQQSSKKPKTDPNRQTQRSQSKSIRSNLSRASEIRNKKGIFKQKFQTDGHIVEQQQLGQTLHEILAMQIGKLISEPLAEVIQASMKEKEDSIFIAFTQTDKDYLQNLLFLEKKKQNNALAEIQSLLARRQDKTVQKLDNGQLFIDKQRAITSKSQIQELSKLDVARLLKIKEGAIRSKLDLLHDKMFELDNLENTRSVSPSQSLKKYQQEKLEQISDPHNFSLNSQKTKIAHDYVKHLQQQKLMLLKKMRQRQQKRTQMQKQRQMQLKQADEMRNAAKKQQVQQRIKQYSKKKQQQSLQIKQKSLKVQQFLKQYRKSLPLYKKKEKIFNEHQQKKKNKQIEEKLKEIRQNRRSLSLNEIKQHQNKYLERRSIDQSKKEEEFKMMLKARKATQSGKQYFKGFYHEKVKILDQQERLKFYSLRQSTKMKVDRVTQFDEKIRKLHKPKIDPKKKQDLQRYIELEQLKKKKVKKMFKQVVDQSGQTRLQPYYQQIPEVNLYRQGNKFMQIGKSLAKKKKADEGSRYSEQPHIDLQQLQKSEKQQSKSRQKSVGSDWQTPSPIISQQKDIWRLRSKQLHQMTGQISPQNFYQIKKNLQVMDDKAKLRQQLLKHKQSDAHEIMQQKTMLDEFYLESIKNKIKLLNQ